MKKLMLILLMLTLLMLSCAEEKKIIIKGSTTVSPVILKIIEKYKKNNPDISFQVDPRGTSAGISSIIDGTCDITMASRSMKPNELNRSLQKKRDLQESFIGIGALSPIVDKSNPIKNITINQLEKIYSGEITNWRELGGPDRAIKAVTRNSSSGTFGVFVQNIMRNSPICECSNIKYVKSHTEMLQQVANDIEAIGYIIGSNKSVTLLSVNDIFPTRENAISEKYPVVSSLVLISDKNSPKYIKDFVKFAQNKNQGQKIVSEMGFFPVGF